MKEKANGFESCCRRVDERKMTVRPASVHSGVEVGPMKKENAIDLRTFGKKVSWTDNG